MPRPISKTEALAMVAKAKKSPNHGKHGKHKKTLLKEEVFKQMQERIMARTMKLANAQTMLGLGTIKVFRIDAHYEMFGKQKKLVKEKPVRVTSDEEIIKVLDYEYADGSDPTEFGNDTVQFYFVETKDADNRAIDSQLDRVYGKAANTLDLTSKGEKIAAPIIGMTVIKDDN